MIGFFKNIISWTIWKIKNQFFLNQWQLLYTLKDDINFDFRNFIKIIPPKDRFWADPFIVKHKKKFFIFFEELIYKENKGSICCLNIDDDGNISDVKKVLEKKYHLSYPFIFNESNNFFMIPETIENRTIELYKCDKFPDMWSLYKVLISDIEAVDSTILVHNSKYWLFANVKNKLSNSTWDELHLFYSDNLMNGDWVSHKLNPIVSDVSSSRPAGKIFKKNNKIFRPAQNCSLHYGYGIELQEIIVLNEFEYKEKNIRSFHPLWDNKIDSIHTINHEHGITVIDAKTMIRKFF